ncbi:MAG TPA: 3'(2'),5'-bisphosphate nucleotidase CysQ, partial [Saprospiraceae bacterium]|nr:3'(2'),5'-bisphosphate nucleotidase CysQ [Saprospiraceae bacterium]
MITEKGIEEILSMLRKAGEVILHYYKNDEESLDTQLKTDNTPVTIADTASNDIIYNFLKTSYPEIPIISEETEIDSYEIRSQWDYVWLIDPLDGTKEFLDKTDEFAINLALVGHGKSILGFIYLPVFKQMYYAAKDQGAFEIKNGIKSQISVSRFNLQQKGIKVVSSRSYMDINTSSYIDILDAPEMIKLGSSLKFV